MVYGDERVPFESNEAIIKATLEFIESSTRFSPGGCNVGKDSSVQYSYILNSTTYNSKILTIHAKRTRQQRFKTCYRKINTLDRKLIQYTNTN